MKIEKQTMELVIQNGYIEVPPKQYYTCRLRVSELKKLYDKMANKRRKGYGSYADFQNWVKTNRKLEDYFYGKKIEICPEGACYLCWNGSYHKHYLNNKVDIK